VCGRYASTSRPETLAQEFDIDEILGDLPGPDYNVAPTVAVPAVLERRSRVDDAIVRRLSPLVWGLVPSWAKDAKGGARLINARLESVAEKPAFRRAFAARRCLLPADGFYEWYAPEASEQILGRAPSGSAGQAGKARKQPFFIHRADGGLLVMAGIYEIWRDPAKDRDDDSAWLRTCSVITTEATDAVGHIHDRMPMVVPRSAWDAWLDPTLTDPHAALDLLQVTEPAALEAYAVSTAVNSVRNNDPSLLDPLPTDDGAYHDDGPVQDTLL
jgi:putative SOS response-associated peptidase YedK